MATICAIEPTQHCFDSGVSFQVTCFQTHWKLCLYLNCLTDLMRPSRFCIKWKKEVTSRSAPIYSRPSPWPCQSAVSLSTTPAPPDPAPAPALNKDLMSPNHLSGKSDQLCNTQQQDLRMRPHPDTEVLKNNSRKKQHNPTITVITLPALGRSFSRRQSALAYENLIFTSWERMWCRVSLDICVSC